MEPIVLIGAGGHGKVVADILWATGRYRVESFLDEDPSTWKHHVLGVPVVSIERLPEFWRVKLCLVTVGDNNVRWALAEEAAALGFRFPVAVNPSAVVAPSAHIGMGTVVAAGAIVNPDAVVGPHSIINTGAIIEHDNILGRAVHISPGVALSGGVTIGDRTHMGTGSCAIPGVAIGADCIVGAGTVVIRDLPDRVVAVGSPARIIKERRS